MKRTCKIIVMLAIVFTILATGVMSYAKDPKPASSTDPSAVLTNIGTGSTDAKTENLTKMGQSIVGVVRLVGIIVAVVILLILGIKYMVGSAEEKAEYKKTMVPYLVGAVLVFAASAIVGVVFDMANGLNGTGTASE